MPTDEFCSRRVLLILVLIFAVMAAGILLTGTMYYRGQERAYRSVTENELSAIADLKAGELSLWIQERLADADVFMNKEIND